MLHLYIFTAKNNMYWKRCTLMSLLFKYRDYGDCVNTIPIVIDILYMAWPWLTLSISTWKRSICDRRRHVMHLYFCRILRTHCLLLFKILSIRSQKIKMGLNNYFFSTKCFKLLELLNMYNEENVKILIVLQ